MRSRFALVSLLSLVCAAAFATGAAGAESDRDEPDVLERLGIAKELFRFEFERDAQLVSCGGGEFYRENIEAGVGRALWSEDAERAFRVVLSAGTSNDAVATVDLVDRAGDAVPLARAVRSLAEVRSDCRTLADLIVTKSVVAYAAITPTPTPTPGAGWPQDSPASSAPPSPSPSPSPSATHSPPVPPSTPAPPDSPPGPILGFFGVEGGYSFWSGGRLGPDDAYQNVTYAGTMVAGGSTRIGRYHVDLLVIGMTLTSTSTRYFQNPVEINIRDDDGRGEEREYLRQDTGASAMRAVVRWEGADAGVSLGLLAGGLQRNGCRHPREQSDPWFRSPVCGRYQEYAALPVFGARMGPERGPYAEVGFLDGRFLTGDLVHLGAGAVFRGNVRLEGGAVAAWEGLGARLEAEIPVRDSRAVIIPAIAGGTTWDSLTAEGSRNNWVRAGVAIGLRE